MRYIRYFYLFLACCGLSSASASAPFQSQLRAAQHDTTRLHLCVAQAHEYHLKNSLDSVLYYVEAGFKLAKKLNTTQYHSKLYGYKAFCYRSKKQYDHAIQAAQQAIAYGKKHQQFPQIEYFGYLLAIIYADKAYQIGSVETQVKSVRQLFENIRFCYQHPPPFTYLNQNYALLSEIYKANGNDSLAYLYAEKQLSFLEKPKNVSEKLFFLENSLDLFLYQKQKDKAHNYLLQILNLRVEKEQEHFYHYVLFGAIAAYMKFKYFDDAFKIIQKIQSNPTMMTKIDTHWKFQLNNDLTTIYLSKKNYRLAQQAHKQAIYFSKKEVLPFGDRLKLLINQQQLLEHQKRFEEALKLNKRIHIMQDSLASTRFEFELATNEERFNFQIKERLFQQQLKVNQLENQRKTQALDNARQLQWVFTILVLFLIAVVAIIALQMNKIKQQSTTLKKLNAAKNQLFAIIGHDLRSPILALLSSLERIPEPSKDVQKMLPRINNLLLTTDNLLYWAESQQNNARYQPESIAISDIIAEVLALLETSIEEGQLEIIDEVSDTALVKVDENHLRIIIRNVVQNAIKFTPANGQIKLTTQQLAKATELRIEDTGIGYEQTQKESPFKSTQLGLKLVRNLIAINKGSFSIQNNDTQGTIVSIILPLPS